ncbi:YkvA family protein [Cesiribacter andamanensis]|uniref:DUF1232 domain-containing protein n=1 Tax=Cesiribacter andamanensis AMV16 TaxID=1279009 RepID=M7N4F0_9BACT|nr:YkvA family protein [Cesiribacter andamanensis]EMR02101.1 hypothetical protein ADICEAN_02763 [Cesiribacter andamanensis AMV16]
MRNRTDDFLTKVLQFINKEEAEDIAQKPGEIDQLVDKSKRKMTSVKGKQKVNFKDFFFHLTTFQRLLRAYARKEYPSLPWKSLLSIIGAILYFINPLDLIPDFIPAIGLIDDITLLAWVYKSIAGDVARFEVWEQNRRIAHN